jgi:hypothetical protein
VLGQDPQELLEQAEREPAGMGILAAAALAGGTVLGTAAMESIRRGWIEEPELPEEQPVHEELVQFFFANVGLVMAGHALREAALEMGPAKFGKTMLGYSAGLFAFKLLVDGVRKLRGK